MPKLHHGRNASNKFEGYLARFVSAMEDESSSSLSSPRSSCGAGAARIKCLCSYGGRILPRPQDGKLRYVGGETRILVLERGEALASVMAKLEKLCSSQSPLLLLKYQLPSEELDALVSVVSDEDLEHMLDECAKLGTERLRTFVFFRTKPSAAMVKRQLLARLEGSPRSCLDALKFQASPEEHGRRVTALASPPACCGSPRQHYYQQQQQLATNEYLFGGLGPTCSNCTAAVVQDHHPRRAAGLLEARYSLIERQQKCCRQVVAPRNPGLEYVVPAVRHFS